VGAESLTIEFPLTPYLGSGREAGWNGLYFWSTSNCWVRDVSIINSDMGIALDGAYFCTVQDVQLGSGPRGPDNGLWGIWLKNGADVLLRNVQFATRFLRDVAVQGAQVGTVVANCELWGGWGGGASGPQGRNGMGGSRRWERGKEEHK
jgi:hypothetical protein